MISASDPGPPNCRSTPTAPPLVLTDPVGIVHTGTHAPTITAEQWPRGSLTGLPMAHALTVQVPEEYLAQGPEFVGVSFFQVEGQSAEQDAGVAAVAAGLPLTATQATDPFLVQLAGTVGRDHPRLRRM